MLKGKTVSNTYLKIPAFGQQKPPTESGVSRNISFYIPFAGLRYKKDANYRRE